MQYKRILALILITFLSACGSPPAPIVPTSTSPAPTDTQIPPTPSDTTMPSATLEPTATLEPSITPEPSLTLTPTLGVSGSAISPLDNMTLVLVPEGPFRMGSSSSDGMAYPDEMPQHAVTMDAFWIDQTEVSNGQYALCVKAKACKPPIRYTSNIHDHYYNNTPFDDYPVIYVSWTSAEAYCRWAGRRLPTEAEWEKAARGTDGRIYPWGNSMPDESLLNFNNLLKDVTKDASYPSGASPYGALDMAGNVWEWVADWYGMNYYSESPAANPTGPASGTQRVLRGGSWHYDAAGVRTAYRFQKEPTFASYEIGFRCATSTAP